MTLTKTFTFFLSFALLAFINIAEAQRKKDVAATTDYEPVFMPELFATSITIDDDNEYPIEPNLQEVEFLKRPPVNSIGDRVERLIEGITVDVPPEYDHYGFEIRRYMASVGHPKIHNDENEDFLIEQIKNVRKAKVIADYWRKYLENEIAELEPLVKADEVPFTAKTAYKQHSITVRTFLISLISWLDANEVLLMYIFEHPGVFDLYYPEIIFVKPNLRIEYFNYAANRAQKLKDIRAYQPFAMMVY